MDSRKKHLSRAKNGKWHHILAPDSDTVAAAGDEAKNYAPSITPIDIISE